MVRSSAANVKHTHAGDICFFSVLSGDKLLPDVSAWHTAESCGGAVSLLP